jgi:DNA uptake protein ComE-like DNA-binding protein
MRLNKVQNCGMRFRFAIVFWGLALALAQAIAASAPIAQPPVELTDINRASLQALEKVPGMTEAWAARIVRFRPYRTKLDLVEQGVVTPEVYQRIRDRVIAHRIATSKVEVSGRR